MHKPLCNLLAAFCLLAACAAPPQAAGPQTSAGPAAASAATVDTAVADNNEDYETIFVPPPVGSMLGGGSVRVAKKKISGTDESALLGNIRRLDAAAGTKDERRFAVASISRATGVSANELQAQQDVLQLRFGELCAINAIARGNSNKVQEIANMRRKGQTWASLARVHGANLAAVVQTVRNANEMTVAAYSNAMDRAKGGQNKIKAIGVKTFPRPQDG